MIRPALAGVAAIGLVALGVAIYRFNADDGGFALSGQTRVDFVRSAVEGCVRRQTEAADGEAPKRAQVDRFCGCYAEALAGRVTTSDLERLNGRPAAEIQATLRPKMEASDDECLAKPGSRPN